MAQKCAHCDGRGSTNFSCCAQKTLGHYDKGGFNQRVKCCACNGTGREGESDDMSSIFRR